MLRVFALDPLPATQSPRLVVAVRPVPERVADIRRHLVNCLPHGSKKAIATRLRRGKERVSRELYESTEFLKVDTLAEALDELRAHGLHQIAHAIHEALDESAPAVAAELQLIAARMVRL